jgi:CMP/dCMP kinase
VDEPSAVAARAALVSLSSGTDPDHPTIALDGVDVSREIRTDPVTAAVSQVSAVPQVRKLMVALQRHEIGDGGIVVEGRDIGTVVAPAADLKVFLTADPGARARRRAAELTANHNRDLGFVEADLARRDTADSSRAVSPMAVADDAITVDSTYLSLDDVVEAIVGLARARVAVRHGG